MGAGECNASIFHQSSNLIQKHNSCSYIQTYISEVTPVLGVSETCYNASLEYIHGGFYLVRFFDPGDPLWVGDPN